MGGRFVVEPKTKNELSSSHVMLGLILVERYNLFRI